MDRFTWAVVAGVVGLAIVALVSVTLIPAAQPPPDLSTPDGVVRAYVLALQNKQPDQAWDLLAPEALAGPGPRGRMDRDNFRQQVLNAQRERNSRVRLLQTVVLQTVPETARVETEVVTGGSSPWGIFGGSLTHPATFSLRREGDTWRITSTPDVWQLV